MARIAGIDLPKNKRIEIGLTYIYGIGRTSATKILAETGINPDTRVKDLTEQDEAALREVIGRDYMVEGDQCTGKSSKAQRSAALKNEYRS
jgi:small subunit ribosomal protein S13